MLFTFPYPKTKTKDNSFTSPSKVHKEVPFESSFVNMLDTLQEQFLV